jgi:hypothetical protein
LRFRPAAPRLQFELTMNRNYRKPGRVYRMQAPTRDTCIAWVDAIQKAKEEFDKLGPWQTRGLAAESTSEHVAECTVCRTRQISTSTIFDRPFTMFIVEAVTQGGASFEVQKRFSDFRAFHAEWLSPVMSLGSPLPLPLAVLVGKNDADTVEYRKRGLTTYLREALALVGRLGSPAVTAALQRFLRCSGTVEARDGSEMVPRSELWRQVQGSVWDCVGLWAFNEEISFHGSQFQIRHVLQLSLDGSASFEASGHPEHGGYVRATGSWQNVDTGQRAEVTLLDFDTANGHRLTAGSTIRGNIALVFGKMEVDIGVTVDGVTWQNNYVDQRRLLKLDRDRSSIGSLHHSTVSPFELPQKFGAVDFDTSTDQTVDDEPPMSSIVPTTAI